MRHLEDTALKRRGRSSLNLFSSLFFRFLLILILLLLLANNAICGSIFFWIDKEDGTKHYTNIEPSSPVQGLETYKEEKSSNIETKKDAKSKKDSSSFKDKKKKSVTAKKSKKKSDSSPKYDSQLDDIKFKVLSVYDGDTIKIKGSGIELKIRLIGIDAPEFSKKKSSLLWSIINSQDQPFSKDSKNALNQMVKGKTIKIKSYGTDRYKRTLAEVFAPDGTLVNLEMVKLGMAEVYRGSTNKGFDPKPYKIAEADAKRALKGIWSLGSKYESPKVWRKSH
ncbi:MAG: thermonuclease family protein [Desulfamplus sp.]|nr:thermonuclease family protein [Desulfamplus sp.]